MNKNIFLLALVPLGFLPWGTNPQLPKTVILAFIAIIYLVPKIFHIKNCRQEILASIVKFFRLEMPLLNFLWILWILALLVSLFFCQDFAMAIKRWGDWLLLVIVHFIAIKFSLQNWQRYSQILWISAGFTSIYGIIQSLNLETVNMYPAYTSTYSNVSYAGAAMAIFLLVGTFPQSNFPFKKWFKSLAFLFMFWYLLRTSSRAAWLAFILGLLVYSILSLWMRWKNNTLEKTEQKFSQQEISSQKSNLFFRCLFFLILILIPLLHSDFRMTLVRRLNELSHWQSGSIAVRTLIWKSTVQMIKEHPFGVGLGQFSHHFYIYRDIQEIEISKERLVDHPHNTWLLMLSEVGIICTFIFLAIVIVTFWKLLYFFQHTDIQTRQISITWLAILAALLILSLFSEVWLIPETGIFFPLTTGWLVGHSFKESNKKNNFEENIFPKENKSFFLYFANCCVFLCQKICLLGIVFFLILFSFSPCIADIYLDYGQKQLIQKEYYQAKKALKKAVFFYPQGFHHLEYGRALLATREYKKSAEVLSNVVISFPELEGGHIDLGLAYYALGNYSDAINVWKKAQAYFPKNPIIYNNLIELLLQLRQGNTALDYLLRQSYFFPKVVEMLTYQLQIGQAHQFAGNTKEAMLCYIQTKEKFPQNALPYLYLGRLMAEMGLRDAAIYNISEAIRLGESKEKCMAYCVIGYLMQQEGQHKLAATYFFKARTEFDNYAIPYLYLCQLALELNQNDLAVQYFEQAKSFGFARHLITTDPSFQKLAHSQIYQKK